MSFRVYQKSSNILQMSEGGDILLQKKEINDHFSMPLLYTDFRGSGSDIFPVFGDTEVIAEIGGEEGFSIVDDYDRSYNFKFVLRDGVHVLYLEHVSSVNVYDLDKWCTGRIVTKKSWGFSFSVFLIKYDKIMYIIKADNYVIDTTTIFRLKNDVTLFEMTVILGVSFDEYVRRLYTHLKGRPALFHLYSLNGSQSWMSPTINYMSTTIAECLKKGFDFDFVYEGLDSPLRHNMDKRAVLKSVDPPFSYDRCVLGIDSVECSLKCRTMLLKEKDLFNDIVRKLEPQLNIEEVEVKCRLSQVDDLYAIFFGHMMCSESMSKEVRFYFRNRSKESVSLDSDMRSLFGIQDEQTEEYQKEGICLMVPNVEGSESEVHIQDLPFEIEEVNDIQELKMEEQDDILLHKKVGGDVRSVMVRIEDEEIVNKCLFPVCIMVYDINEHLSVKRMEGEEDNRLVSDQYSVDSDIKYYKTPFVRGRGFGVAYIKIPVGKEKRRFRVKICYGWAKRKKDIYQTDDSLSLLNSFFEKSVTIGVKYSYVMSRYCEKNLEVYGVKMKDECYERKTYMSPETPGLISAIRGGVFLPGEYQGPIKSHYELWWKMRRIHRFRKEIVSFGLSYRTNTERVLTMHGGGRVNFIPPNMDRFVYKKMNEDG